MMTAINRVLLSRGVEGRFATFFYAVMTRDGQFTYTNAGHNPPALLSARGRRWLTTGGTVLGMFENTTFEEEVVDLRAGDAVVCFTDGVTEAMDSKGDEFGEERLLSCLTDWETQSSTDLIDRIFDDVRRFCGNIAQRDDVTMLVARFLPDTGPQPAHHSAKTSRVHVRTRGS